LPGSTAEARGCEILGKKAKTLGRHSRHGPTHHAIKRDPARAQRTSSRHVLSPWSTSLFYPRSHCPPARRVVCPPVFGALPGKVRIRQAIRQK